MRNGTATSHSQFRRRRRLSAGLTSGAGALFELVVIVGLAIGLALVIQALIVKPYHIPSEAMEPTFAVS
jgi:signal peptidase I